MSRWRGPLGAGVIVALAVAVWAALSSGEDEPIPEAAPVTTTTASTETIREASSSTQSPSTSTSTSSTSIPPSTATSSSTTVDAAARTEEVRLIVQDLWFRWFDAIYHEDEEAASGVVATGSGMEGYERAIEENAYKRAPQRDEVIVSSVDVLRDDSECLAVKTDLDLSLWLGDNAKRSVVEILWLKNGSYRRVSLWESETDLWENDCVADKSSS